MRICAIGTTRNEVDLVAINLQHHCAQGIDSFLIRDNGSTDGTQDELSRLSKHLPLEWSQYKGPFLQDRLLSDLAVEAFHRGADWVIPVDADEFWHVPDGTLREVLDESGDAGVLEAEVVNFVQQRSQDELAAANQPNVSLETLGQPAEDSTDLQSTASASSEEGTPDPRLMAAQIDELRARVRELEIEIEQLRAAGKP